MATRETEKQIAAGLFDGPEEKSPHTEENKEAQPAPKRGRGRPRGSRYAGIERGIDSLPASAPRRQHRRKRAPNVDNITMGTLLRLLEILQIESLSTEAFTRLRELVE